MDPKADDMFKLRNTTNPYTTLFLLFYFANPPFLPLRKLDHDGVQTAAIHHRTDAIQFKNFTILGLCQILGRYIERKFNQFALAYYDYKLCPLTTHLAQ